jgi:replication factor A1
MTTLMRLSELSTEDASKFLESLKVEKLTPESRNVNIKVKVVKKTEPRETVSRNDGTKHRVSDVLVGDETGCVYLSLWDDNIDKVSEGDIIEIKNGYLSLFRGSMRLNVGREGSFEKSQGEMGEVNAANNLSDKQYEMRPRYPSFRPRYGDDRGYGGSRGGYGNRGRRRY